ncbi:exported hypothetical protein [Agrobacterium tumefaciens str. Kerr 14]|uniref:Periplasmic binding protein domain-containing protein n=1 Tax=Agrobacterium tumefaciens str. Kerr 14 TaxID=1183424 RepID=A0A1S7SA00_AGRTU|nr:sugar ABC transporter substrate-binding protein [Agrobacterium tumefaciens]CUX65226.1 exported hypothetical protein [Agrobacterium tumefaciens str. Kerr 14]
MKLRKQLIAASVATMSVICGAVDTQASDVSEIYVGVGSASSEYWAAFIAGSKAVSASLGKDVKVVASDFNGQKLMEQLGAVLAAGCEDCAIAADPASNAFTKAVIDRAEKAGAKYVNLWNRPDQLHPWDTAPDTWVANTAFDGVASGYSNGMALCKALNGKGNIVALQGIPDNPPAKQRLAGLHKALGECPGLKLLDTQVGNWDQTQGQTITRAWLAKIWRRFEWHFLVQRRHGSWRRRSVARSRQGGEDSGHRIRWVLGRTAPHQGGRYAVNDVHQRLRTGCNGDSAGDRGSQG